MQERKRRFRTAKFRFETDTGTCRERYMILDSYTPLFRVNQWLELKGMRKASTGQEYAKKGGVLNLLEQTYSAKEPDVND